MTASTRDLRRMLRKAERRRRAATRNGDPDHDLWSRLSLIYALRNRGIGTTEKH